MINQITLIGNVGKQPEIKSTKSGEMARFSLATNRSKKDQSGNWQQETEWHNIVVFGYGVEVVKKIQRGSLVYVDGRIHYNKFEDKDGNMKNYTDIIANKIKLLEKTIDEPVNKNNDNDEMPF